MKFLSGLLCVLLLAASLNAGSNLPRSPAQRLSAADATGLARLVTSHTYRDQGVIHTRFTFRTSEALRGAFPAYFQVTSPGGIYQGQGNADSRLPRLQPGNTYLLNLRIVTGQLRFADDTAGILDPHQTDLPALRALTATLAAGADLSPFATGAISVNYEVTASGLLEENGVRRFISPDRGEPISVYADVSTLPAGISESQAINALQNALAAWSAVSTVRFNYLGTQVFAQSADTFSAGGGLVIRVQFHDAFDQIPDGGSTLGFGGAGFQLAPGEGATVAGTAFNPITHGFVVLNHPQTALQDPLTLEEVLTHEIGHVIGLAHSSEDGGEADTSLSGAIMYFQAHDDGRGATLNAYDITTVLKAHPLNTPPYGYNRMLRAITIPGGTISNPKVNQVTLSGADLQGTGLTLQIDSQTSLNGTFSINGTTVTYTPSGFFADADIADPFTSFNDRLTARLSDGVNLSPTIDLRVIGFRSDTQPAGAPDGVPDSWMTTYYGASNGSTAAADTDGDGLTNLNEFLIGTNPTDAASAFKITAYTGDSLTWATQRFDSYTVQTSTDLATWTTQRHVTQPDATATLTLTGLPTESAEGRLFFRVLRQD
jgi:hypothetical protein